MVGTRAAATTVHEMHARERPWFARGKNRSKSGIRWRIVGWIGPVRGAIDPLAPRIHRQTHVPPAFANADAPCVHSMHTRWPDVRSMPHFMPAGTDLMARMGFGRRRSCC